jgi:hypothetical protein
MVKKKVKPMQSSAEKLIGSRDLRSNLSDYMDQVLQKKQVFLVGKKFKPRESAALINKELLELLLAGVEFHSSVNFDASTKQYTAEIDGFNAGGVGDTPEAAVEMALDNIENLVEDFFTDFDYYRRFPIYLERFPHYLKLKLAGSREELATLLGLAGR